MFNIRKWNFNYLPSVVDKILRKMSLPSNNMMEMHIRSKPMGRRQRAGDENSEESVGYVIYASEGINLFFPIIAATEKTDRALVSSTLVCAGMKTLAVFALLVGGAGASKIYSTDFFIFLGTPTTTLGQISKIFAAIGIFFTYPLQLNAAYHYIVDELHIDNKDLIKYGLRVLLMIELTRNDSMPKYAPLICKKKEKM
ncbi:hypothetical protein GQX74_013316 [Glossina fuscipes]|nr:hypothetical protein GQX74_013316 [Glossina fuscipes]